MNLEKIKILITKISAGKTFRFAVLFFLLMSVSVGTATHIHAQMAGTAYKIPLDSINVGGQDGSSTSYGLFDTVGEIATGDSASGSYGINAGFIGAQLTYLAISSGSDVTMSPAISGVSGGVGSGSTVWTVITDNPAGYSLTIKADTNPALRSASSDFADYTTSGAAPDYLWSVASADSEYGFTPEGVDIIQRYKDNGATCDAIGGSDTTDRCWDKLTTSDQQIAERTTGNHPSGTTTTVKMQAEVGSSHIQPNGNYEANITVTAVAL